jgi:hypothetical protein
LEGEDRFNQLSVQPVPFKPESILLIDMIVSPGGKKKQQQQQQQLVAVTTSYKLEFIHSTFFFHCRHSNLFSECWSCEWHFLS